MAYALRSRLSPTVNDVSRRCQVLRRYPCIIESQSRSYASLDGISDDKVASPAKFTTSRANNESARAAREKATFDNTPWSQTVSLGLSLAAFLIYFGFLREENDLDDTMYDSIDSKVPGFKEVNEKLRSTGFQPPRPGTM